MIIRDFETKYLEEAMEIALDAYNYERAFIRDLPEISSIPILKQLSENGFGVAAFEGGKMVLDENCPCNKEVIKSVFVEKQYECDYRNNKQQNSQKRNEVDSLLPGLI